jgi:serine/threonine protein kinase
VRSVHVDVALSALIICDSPDAKPPRLPNPDDFAILTETPEYQQDSRRESATRLSKHCTLSLVSAVSHLHFGPSKTNQQKSWDPIFHRDIIAGNVFYSSRPANETSGMISQAYPIVKLADFGCALRESEVKTMSLNPDFPYNKGVPVIEPSCEPPEGPFANGPVDIFEIGVLMSDFILVDGFPVTRQPGFQYSSQLRYLVKLCREHNPRMRPNACSLLAGIRRDRQLLSSWGKLAYVELLP